MSDRFEDADTETWTPPTESELKVMQARRDRQDRISKLMGEYLLKGYKMLGTCCSECQTILLRDRQGVDYCVACSELAEDNVKDDPALSSEAAERLQAEQSQRSQPHSSITSPEMDHTSEIVTVPVCESSTSSSTRGVGPGPLNPPTVQVLQETPRHSNRDRSPIRGSVNIAMCAVQHKMETAARELVSTADTDRSMQLCLMIKHCAETLEALIRIDV